ncbi:MAG: hypothetical protein ACI94Y_003617, partial [Maribacter sp.]
FLIRFHPSVEHDFVQQGHHVGSCRPHEALIIVCSF